MVLCLITRAEGGVGFRVQPAHAEAQAGRREARRGVGGGGGDGGGEKELRDDEAEKLICDLHDKKGYVCHYRNLQLYVALGLRVTRLHRTLVFRQSDFMRRFVEFNIAQRIRYKGHPFKSDLYKLFNNSTFGRSMMNKRKQGSIQLVSSARRMEKILYRQRSYLDHRIVNEHLCLVRVRGGRSSCWTSPSSSAPRCWS